MTPSNRALEIAQEFDFVQAADAAGWVETYEDYCARIAARIDALVAKARREERRAARDMLTKKLDEYKMSGDFDLMAGALPFVIAFLATREEEET